VMVVGNDSQSFRNDLEQLPQLLVDFISVASRALGRTVRRLAGHGRAM